MHGRPWRFQRQGWPSVIVAVTLVLTSLAGALATWQWVLFRKGAAQLRPQGAWAQVDDFSLYYQCMGTGSPAVVLEAAFTATSDAWAWIQPAVATVTRVCAYDRAGLGWSEESHLPHDAQHIARQLDLLLNRARVSGPYLLVGHSMGGLFIREYAGLYPSKVAGLVALDPVAPGELKRLPAPAAAGYFRLYRLVAIAPLLARLGLLRIYNPFLTQAKGLPAPSYATIRHFFNSPQHLAAMHAELLQWYVTGQEVRRTRLRPDLPLVVIGAGKTQRTNPAVAKVQQEMQRELASQSRQGRYLAFPDAGHAELVTDAAEADKVSRIIIEMVQQLRASGRDGAPHSGG